MDSIGQRDTSTCGIKSKAFWICCIVAALLVIAAVVGGVVGSTHHKSSSLSVPVQATSTKSRITTSTSASASPTPTRLIGIHPDSKLATVAVNTSSTTYQYRVYYQDVDNSLKESAYYSRTNSWNVRLIIDGSGVAPGTSLADASVKEASAVPEKTVWLFP